MTILLTGAAGQLGHALRQQVPAGVELIATSRSGDPATDLLPLDLADAAACRAAVLEHRSDWVLNGGAYTAVDKAESEPEQALGVNGGAPRAFAEALADTGGRLLQVSTDFVFNGQQGSLYRPECPRPGSNPLAPSPAPVAGGRGMTSTAVKLSQFRAVEQAQKSLEFAAVIGGGVELEGKSASIKSISECIQSSNAISFSICFLSFFSCSFSIFSCSICISTTGSRRQLSIRKKERKGESDEPDAPLLLERELAVGEGDVVIGRKKRDQANNTAADGLQQGFAVKPQAPPGRRGIQIPKNLNHPKQPTPIPTSTSLVHVYASTHV